MGDSVGSEGEWLEEAQVAVEGAGGRLGRSSARVRGGEAGGRADGGLQSHMKGTMAAKQVAAELKTLAREGLVVADGDGLRCGVWKGRRAAQRRMIPLR